MDIKNYLNFLGIEFKEFKHSAVYTCEEARKDENYVKIKGMHCKNLFLKERNSKSFYLVVMPENKPLDIRELEKNLGCKIKFANEENLKDILGLTPGAVSPFGLINDKESKTIVLIDKDVWEADFVSFHPNVNTETLELSGSDFQKYIDSLKNVVRVI